MRAPETQALRIDKWLWFARLVRSRSLAARLCLAGQVTVAGNAAKPHHAVRVGDAVTIELARATRRVRVVALGARRGPAPEARRLYEEPAPPVPRPRELWRTLLDEEEAAP